jgi:hypothetical protein
VVENPLDRELVGEEGDHLHLLSAASADERINLVDLDDESYAEFGIRLIMPGAGLCRVATGATGYPLDLVVVSARGRVIRSA